MSDPNQVPAGIRPKYEQWLAKNPSTNNERFCEKFSFGMFNIGNQGKFLAVLASFMPISVQSYYLILIKWLF